METPFGAVVMVVVVLWLGKLTMQDPFAEECRVYKLIGGNKYHYSTPNIPVHNLLTVSIYNSAEGDFPHKIHIILKGKEKSHNIHITELGEVFIDRLKNRNFTLTPACRDNTWVSLVILLQDQNIILYRIDDRETYISANNSIGSNVTGRVTTSQPSTHITFNCPASCFMHDQHSPLIGRRMPLGDGINIYLRHEEEASNAKMVLGFRDHNSQDRKIRVDITKLKPSLWHKVVILHDKQDNIFVTSNGEEKGKVLMSEDNASFAILNSTSIVWSLHCHPERATGLEGWGFPNSSEEEDDTRSVLPDKGAGIGEVLAWVLAGTALFMVMGMALLLCSKMGAKGDNLDQGASVGVVTSFGRQMTFQNAEREAEEDTEPDSPTLFTPVIHHKVPEEEDEQQSNTKML